ncbi:APC family permease [Ureaplasma miroungigenitalium]|uniref:APC family permease n=1 Tax=Ureaplasma miroungigenitalium TaxID=1042321 RepID=A0ABT3BMG7_9BACT|nr:APC family permease [Ureaplasma miroungigenitalium]MCV3728417.1 APC family permease [Ureaplasma miroungigenitalium]MCV3734204.1 APC family permease [Ureaplasma miroungigenitalium]
MINNEIKEKKVLKKLEKNKKVSLIGFVLLTASAIVAFYTFPSLSTAGWIAIIFAFVTAFCWFIPIGMAAAEMATIKGWTHGGLFTWVRNLIGPRAGFLVTWLQFQVTFGFVAMVLFILSSFSFGFAGGAGYNYFNTLKLGTTLNQASSINLSKTFNSGSAYGIAIAVLFVLIMLSLWGQKRVHQMGQIALIIGILLPFAIVLGFSFYTIANLDDPLYYIGKSFLKEGHLSPNVTGSSYELNKTFMSSTVMASFMAFSFSLHGVEVSAIASNRMNNPSKQYPRAMAIVVAIALICIVIGSIMISMTVPTSTLSFNGGLVQTIMFNLSVGGVDVKLPNETDATHFTTLAHAYEVVERDYGTAAANQVMYQYIYHESLNDVLADANSQAAAGLLVKSDELANPIANPSQFIQVIDRPIDHTAMRGFQTISFFTGIGVLIEVSVWMSNLSTGLNYAMRQAHFPKWTTYQIKNGSALTVSFLWFILLSGIFAVYMFGYNSLLGYEGKTITDILANEGVNADGEKLNLSTAQLDNIKEQFRAIYHYDANNTKAIIYHFDFNHISNEQVQKVMDNIANVTGYQPVASGIPASVTNIGFISNVVSQISMYYIGYNIFLIGYIRFVIKANYLKRSFRIKHRWLQILLASLAIGVNSFAVVATYLPAAPELYPGATAYYVFISIALPMFICTLTFGLMVYLINYIWNKKRGVNLKEMPNLSNVDQNVLDLIKNPQLYVDDYRFADKQARIAFMKYKYEQYLTLKNKDELRRANKELAYLSQEFERSFPIEIEE